MKKFLIILLSVIALVVLVGGGFVGKKLYDKYSEGTDRADLWKLCLNFLNWKVT